MRPSVRCVRISKMPSPRDRHTGSRRPSKFDRLDILTDELAILGWQAFQPFPEQLSRFRAEENRRDSLTVRPLRWRQCGFGRCRRFPLCWHVPIVPHTVHASKVKSRDPQLLCFRCCRKTFRTHRPGVPPECDVSCRCPIEPRAPARQAAASPPFSPNRSTRQPALRCASRFPAAALIPQSLSIEHRQRNPRNLTQRPAVRFQSRHCAHALDRRDEELR